jgi:hypothetical protein
MEAMQQVDRITIAEIGIEGGGVTIYNCNESLR